MQKPVNKNSSKNAAALLEFLAETTGNRLITGQHTQSKGMEELALIKEKTGKNPKLIGFELLSYSPNIVYEGASTECLTEIYDNRGTLDDAYSLGLKGDTILTFTFHWFSPLGGHDKSFFTENTDFDAEKILIPDTPERNAFYSDMDKLAEELKRFNDADIPILWRPFHESEGKWFWWGAKGPAVAAELYKLMYKHFTEYHKLNNLLWVWNCPLKEGYPGDEYVDVISRDLYLPKAIATDYQKEYTELINATTKEKVAALGEIGILPDADLLSESHTPWAYYMTWSHDYCLTEKFNSFESLKRLYDNEYTITD